MLLSKINALTFCLLSFAVAATDVPKPPEKLPLGTVLDSQGNPINLPKKTESSLEYQSKQALPKRVKSDTTQPKKKPKGKQSHKQLTSNTKVANDPNCRWLAQRMKQLRKQKSSSNGYHKQELSIREKEWKCMKCGAEGPKQEDYARCQHRR